MRLVPTSVRTRLTLWYTAALAIPLVAFAVVSWLLFAGALLDRTDAFLTDALAVFTAELGNEQRRIPTLEGALVTTLMEVRFRDLDIVVLDSQGGVVAASAPHPTGRPGSGEGPPGPLFDAGAVVSAVVSVPGAVPSLPWNETITRPEGRYRLFVRPLEAGGRSFQLAGVYPLLEVDDTLDRIRGLFLVLIPLLVMSAAGGGWFLAARSFRPVTAMAGRAAEIGATTLHERLPVVADDELGALARVLNDLLDRLERSFLQQRRFMADASHELRTPTAIVRTEADVTLSRPHREEGEYRASLEIVQDASRRLTRIVDDIFLLARADAGHLVVHPAPLYLDELVRDTGRAVRPLAGAGGVTVEVGELPEAPFVGDSDLLGRLLLNLLDNAIKHSPPGGRVEVDMEAAEGGYSITVTDQGPGIPGPARERVFERFFRVDSARARQESTLTSGAGLGLPIARRIADIHGGTVELLESSPGRTVFRARLPGGGYR